MASSVPPVSISGTSSRGQAKLERAIAVAPRARFDLGELPAAPIHTCSVYWEEYGYTFQVSYKDQDLSPIELKALIAEQQELQAARRIEYPDLTDEQHAVIDLADTIHRMVTGWADDEGKPILRNGTPVQPSLGELETSRYSMLGSIVRDINEDRSKRRAQQVETLKARQKADRIATGTA